MQDTLCVTTRDSLDDILRANNSAAWYLQPRRAREMKYLVCAALNPDEVDLNRKPFLVAEISEVVLDQAASKERKRYAICFERFAKLDISKERKLTGSQNPVRWGSISEFIQEDIRKLRWMTVSEKLLDYSYSRREPREPAAAGLSIEEAKAGLAARFGVPLHAIEIVIRA